MMNEVISVAEYEEGFALIEDTQGKYMVTRDSSEITDLQFPRCFLTDRDRQALLT